MAMTTIPHRPPSAAPASFQTSLFGAGPLQCRSNVGPFVALDGHSSVLFEPAWAQGTDPVFSQLRDEMPWRAVERPMYDRIVTVPRLICTIELSTMPDTHPLAEIGAELSDALAIEFTSVGLNLYRDGQDSVAWHRDRVGHHRHASTVALVSLGAPRTLQMRRFRPAVRSQTASLGTTPVEATPVETSATPVTRRRWQLGHGDLLVMAGACQRDWEHCVPKERASGPRISLAFRCKEGVEGPRIGRAGVPPLRASHNLQ